jgi:serine/threonine protein kinase
VNEKMGRYEILACLAHGAQDSTYLGRQRGEWGFERIFTIKLVAGERADDRQTMTAFLREARIGGMLSHPHLVRVVDVGSHHGRPFLVLDHLEGTTLAGLLGLPGPPPPALMVSVVLDVLGGLQAAHDLRDATGRPLGLVHGNLGPAEVVVGTTGVARLGGFRGARLDGEPELEEHGPLCYRAPEQLRGEGVDRRADVFSVGVLLWTALTGRQLFADASYGQTILNVLGQEVKPPSAHGAPPSLDEICLRALARPPGQRYQSAAEMRLALQHAACRDGLLAEDADARRFIQRAAGRELDHRRRVVLEATARA